uniref:Uncharacterized protein n=1 Tax=viral metagenome TaxID=1070528 RepID=A0A6C0JAM8_9ZZZZ
MACVKCINAPKYIIDTVVLVLYTEALYIMNNKVYIKERKINDLQNLLCYKIDACSGDREQRRLLAHVVNHMLDEL